MKRWSWAFVWLRSIYFLKAGDLPRLKPFPQFFYAEKSSPQTFTLLESMLRSNGYIKHIYAVPLWFPFLTQAVHLLNPPSMVEGILSLVGGQCHALDQGLNLFSSQRWRVSKRKRCDSEWLFTRWNTFCYSMSRQKETRFQRQFWWWVVFTGWGLCNVTGHAWEGGFAQVLYIVIEKHWSDVHWCFNDSKQICQKLNTGSMGALAAQEMILLDSGERR